MEINKNKDRRTFIKTGIAGIGGLLLAPSIAKASFFNQNVRLGLIGAGQRGLGIANILKKVANAQLTAICDIDKTALQNATLLAIPGAVTYTDYRKMLADKSIDAVIIATPLYLHHAMATDAIGAGKHVYLEKTMTYNIDQTLDLIRKMKAHNNLVLQVGHQYRYYEMYPKIKQLIADGIIGKVTHYECQYNRNSDWRRPVTEPSKEKLVNWRMYKEFSGGPLAELSAHQIDIVNWMQNAPPLKVVGMGDVNFWKDGRTTFDNIRTVYDYPGGIKASVVSILSNEYNGYVTRILGSTGTIEMTRDKAVLYAERTVKELTTVDGVTGATKEAMLKGQPLTIYTDEKKVEPTAFALESFVKCIRDHQKPFSNVITGRDVAIAVHMGNKAAETGVTQHWEDRFNKI